MSAVADPLLTNNGSMLPDYGPMLTNNDRA